MFVRTIFFNKKIYEFLHKKIFMLLLKMIFWYLIITGLIVKVEIIFDYCIFKSIFVVFYFKVLNLDYSKNVLSSCINYCSMNEDVQSSVQVRMFSTSNVDQQFWHRVYY